MHLPVDVNCSLHICSCSSLITFRTDCRKEEREERKALRVSLRSHTELPGKAEQKDGRACAGHPGDAAHVTAFFTGTKRCGVFPHLPHPQACLAI